MQPLRMKFRKVVYHHPVLVTRWQIAEIYAILIYANGRSMLTRGGSECMLRIMNKELKAVISLAVINTVEIARILVVAPDGYRAIKIPGIKNDQHKIDQVIDIDQVFITGVDC